MRRKWIMLNILFVSVIVLCYLLLDRKHTELTLVVNELSNKSAESNNNLNINTKSNSSNITTVFDLLANIHDKSMWLSECSFDEKDSLFNLKLKSIYPKPLLEYANRLNKSVAKTEFITVTSVTIAANDAVLAKDTQNENQSQSSKPFSLAYIERKFSAAASKPKNSKAPSNGKVTINKDPSKYYSNIQLSIKS